MYKRCVSASGFRVSALLATASLALCAAILDSSAAQARSRHHRHVSHRQVSHAQVSHRHVAHRQAAGPAFASIVVDANSGRVLQAVNENAPRHPASITKVMTLYLLFEQLERGRFTLESDLRVSAHAASMAPTKLGLPPGATIEVDDAIRSIVTKSANDIAVTIAEAIGGTEEHFAELMTEKARSLGMTGTHFENASGLPDPAQITTARDLAILGRAIQERFPKYFPYFSIHSFAWNGRAIRNHNHLLGRVEGVDGIKTGYTRASGFNLLTSAKMGNRRIVSVVLGGRSAGVRDQIMAGLVEKHLENASTTRLASVIVETPPTRLEVAQAEPVRAVLASVTTAAPQPRVEQPVRVVPRTLAFASATAASAALAPTTSFAAVIPARPRLIAVAARNSDEKDRVATIPASIPASTPTERKTIPVEPAPRPVVASAAPVEPPARAMRWIAGPAGRPTAKAEAPQVSRLEAPKKPEATAHGRLEASKPETVKIAMRVPEFAAKPQAAPAKPEPVKPEPESSRPAAAQKGVMIQIGATDGADKAKQLLARARSHNPALASAASFTEKVQKGGDTLYRARFAGLTDSQAETACKSLKRTGFACFPTRN